MGAPFRAAVLTVSDGVSAGTREDLSGEAAEVMLREAGFEVASRSVVADDRPGIEAELRRLAADGVDLVLTTGGTGFGPRDVTPEATMAVIDREAPGLAELMRSEGLRSTPNAALSRATAGVVGGTLVVNLPGSPRGVRESLGAVLPVLPHALGLLAGDAGAHPTGHSEPAAAEHEHPDTAAESPRPGTVIATAIRAVGDPPCRPGQRLVIGRSGPLEGTLGCAEFDSAAVADAPGVLASGEPAVRRYVHELGEVEVFLDPRPAPASLVVVSASPVGLELLRLGRAVGYESVLLEPRSDRVTGEHRSAARTVVGSVEDLHLDVSTDLVCTDHDAPGVVEAVAAALRAPARFVGVMGSRRHVGPHVDALRAMGFSEEDLARVRSPVGLDVGARSPAEIALSIAAGLLASRNGKDGGWLDRR